MARLRTAIHRDGLGYLVALFSVVAVNVLFSLVESVVPVSNLQLIFLVVVLAIASRYGRGPAIAASVLQFLAFDFFHVEPRFTFTVGDPAEWLALGLFLAAAAITGQLAADLRERAAVAEHREHEARLLYEISRLMSGTDLGHSLVEVAERLRNDLGLAAVTIELEDPAAPADAGDASALRELRAVSADRLLAPATERPGRWVKIVHGQATPRPRFLVRTIPLRAGQRHVGTLVLAQPFEVARPEEDRLLSAVALQLGAAIDRAALRIAANEAEILRRTDELRTALLNAVSHDLRTPLASIMAAAGSLRQTDVEWTDEERQEFAEDIEHEAQRLGRIVNNLLDLSRIDAGALKPDRAWHDLGALVEDAVERLSPYTGRHHVLVQVADDLPPILLDAVEIDQVISNLIENAAKYAPAGSEIDVAVRRRPGEVEVEVADRGPGLPAEILNKVFDSFVRVETAGPRPRGLGIGLTVARGLIDAHGGRIWAENRPGGGSRFVFTLPVSNVPTELTS